MNLFPGVHGTVLYWCIGVTHVHCLRDKSQGCEWWRWTSLGVYVGSPGGETDGAMRAVWCRTVRKWNGKQKEHNAMMLVLGANERKKGWLKECIMSDVVEGRGRRGRPRVRRRDKVMQHNSWRRVARYGRRVCWWVGANGRGMRSVVATLKLLDLALRLWINR